jgi:hypothetical protein
MKVFTVGELREFIQPFTDECAIISGLDIEYQLSCGEGRLLVCAAKAAESGRTAPNSAVVPCQHHVVTEVKAYRCDKCHALLSMVS